MTPPMGQRNLKNRQNFRNRSLKNEKKFKQQNNFFHTSISCLLSFVIFRDFGIRYGNHEKDLIISRKSENVDKIMSHHTISCNIKL